MQQHGSKCFTCRPPLSSGLGFKRSKLNFSEDGYVAYQIKWNDECSTMAANVFARRHPHDPRGVVKTFSDQRPGPTPWVD